MPLPCNAERCTVSILLKVGVNLSENQVTFLRKNCLPCKIAANPEDPIIDQIKEQTTIAEIGASWSSQRIRKTLP
ncbi:hypothetical protein M1116_00135 [Patescibacteria group bacterium]|nr:hypothetical protein [Patescibacteria group bacterium]